MKPRARAGLLALITVSTPAAMAVEWAMRRVLLPPEFEQMRDFLRRPMTLAAWAMAAMAAVLCLVGWVAQPALYRGALGPTRRTSTDSARTHALVVSTSLVQLPALAAAAASMMGAHPLAAWTAVVVATAGVLVQGAGIRRLDEGPQQGS